MSDEPSREADLHLAVDAFWARWCSMAGLESVDEHKVRVALEAVVRAFAAAGRLLPEGAERAEEWTMRYRLNGKETCGEDAGHVLDSRAEAEAHIAAWRLHYPQFTYSDVVYLRRDVHVGPWQPITEETDHAV